jgi:uncharacterized protein YyaL (SSP411 family)
VAIRNAEFLTTQLMKTGRLLRTYKAGQAKLNGYLEDYAYVVEGLLAVYEATFDLQFFRHARALADAMIEFFWDDQEGGFYFTSSDHEELITRTKDYLDNATPSGNSVAALALLKLGIMTDDQEYSRRAATILRALQPAMSRYPSAFGYALRAMDFYLSEPKEIALVGDLDSHEIRSFVREIYEHYIPNKVIAGSEPMNDTAASEIKLLTGKVTVDAATAYVCQNYVCLAPATSAEQLASRLNE